MNDLVTTTGLAPVSQAQPSLIAHLGERLAEAAAALRESEDALGYAKAHKWNTQKLSAIVTRNRKEVVYLEKAKAAVEQGYVIMPAVPGEIFAVRINEDEHTLPSATVKDPRSWQRPGQAIPGVEVGSGLPEGEGEYVSPRVTFTWYYYERNEDGKVVKYRREIGQEFIEQIPFPVMMAKPVLMDATERAMALRIFDQIGVFPGTWRRKVDPIIYGQIMRPRRDPLHFLICWLVRKEDI